MKRTLLTIAALFVAGSASAATTGFSLTVSDNLNVPTLVLTNTGDSGEITGLNIAIGNTDYNFDAAYNSSSTGGVIATLDATLDGNYSGGLRSNNAIYTFTSFDPTDVFTFDLDVDIDNSNTVEDYRIRMLPGGSITVTFAGGEIGSLFADLTPTTGNNSSPYFYSASFTAAPVPLPAGLPLMLTALGGAAVLARRKRNA